VDAHVHLSRDKYAPLLFKCIARHKHTKGQRENYEVLIEAGADLNAICMGERSALGFACNIRCCDAPFKFLLRSGADPRLPAYEDETALHIAAEHGHTERCRLLIKASKHTLEMRDSEGRNPLCVAVIAGHSDVVQLFEDCGADIRTRDNAGNTLLHYASECPETRLAVLLHLLLSSGLRPNVANDDGVTPLAMAARAGNKAAVQLLLKYGADSAAVAHDGTAVLHQAVKSGRADLVALLLNILGPEALEASSPDCATPFMLAAGREHLAVMKLLLERGADINAAFSSGETVLHAAAMTGKAEALALLLQQPGAPVHVLNSDGQTPLQTAAHESAACVQLLLEAGADVRVVTPKGCTVWHAAASNKLPDVMQLLLEHGGAADLIDAPAEQCECCGPMTSLMRCQQQAHAALLLAAGADPFRTTANGDTCLHIGGRHGHAAPVMCLLIKAGVDVNAVNHQGQTAAKVADEHGSELAAALLRRVAAKGV
jgi:ankyrin repeat protein